MESKNFIQDYFLGIQYGDFDDRIKASSQYDSNFSVKGCKLNKTMENGHSSAWCAASSDKNAWIEVNLGGSYLITGVSIQGRGDSNQYVTKFRVLYSNDGINFLNISEFRGNNNNTTVEKRQFPIPIYAKFIRIQILEFHEHPSLRFDLHYIPDNIPEIIKNKILSKLVN